jgi:outer membrane lipoprotein SlyB
MAVDAKLGEAFVEIIARMDRFESDLNQARNTTEKSARSMQQSMDGLRSRVDQVSQSIISLRSVVAVLASGGLSMFIRGMIEAGDEIAKTAATIGLTGEQLQEFRHAAGLAGVKQAELTDSLRRFSRGMGESGDEVSTFQRALGRLGLRFSEVRRLGFDEQVKIVSDRLSRMSNITERNAIAFELFGRTGIRAVNFLAQGRAEIEKMADEARRFGLVLSEDTLKKAEQTNDEFDRIGNALRTAGINIAVGFLPVIQQLREMFTDPSFQSGVRSIASGVADLVKTLIDNRDKIVIAVSALAGLRIGAAIGGAALGRQGAITGGVLGAITGMIAGSELMRSEIDKMTADLDQLIRKRDDLAKRIERATTPQDVVALTTQFEALQREIAVKRAAIAELRKSAETDAGRPVEITVRPERGITPIFHEIDLAIKELSFRRGLISDEFRGFAEGFPEMLKALKLQGVDVMDVLGRGPERLTGQFRDLNSAMLDVQAAQLRVDIAGPVEKLNRELDKARVLLNANKISIDEFNTRTQQLQFPQLSQFIQQSGDLRYQLDQLAVGSLNNLGSAFRDVISGSKSLGDAFKQFAIQGASAITEMIFRMLVLESVARMIRNAISGVVGGDLLGGIFGGGTAVAGGGGAAVGNPTIIGGLYHSGGIVGRGGTPIVVPSSLFADAPRMHSGGMIGPGEVPVIARRGEVIGWPAQMRAAFGGERASVEVHIHNAPQGTRVTESSSDSGGRRIDVVIDESVARAVATPGSMSSRSIRTAFGAREMLVSG